MQVITSNEYNKFRDSNTCLAIGAFDGLHKGHQLIISQALKEAKKIIIQLQFYLFILIP